MHFFTKLWPIFDLGFASFFVFDKFLLKGFFIYIHY